MLVFIRAFQQHYFVVNALRISRIWQLLLLVTNINWNSLELKSIQKIATILSVPFCPCTILSIPFCPIPFSPKPFSPIPFYPVTLQANHNIDVGLHCLKSICLLKAAFSAQISLGKWKLYALHCGSPFSCILCFVHCSCIFMFIECWNCNLSYLWFKWCLYLSFVSFLYWFSSVVMVFVLLHCRGSTAAALSYGKIKHDAETKPDFFKNGR